MSQMLKSSGAMGVATLASRVLGMVREMVYASFMGDSLAAGAFKLAYTIPNLFRRLLGEGALTAAFIPIFKDREKNHGEKSMWEAANAVISAVLMATGAIVLVAMIGLTVALRKGHWTDETRMVLELTRAMFPYLTLVCVAAVFIGMLNARGVFFVPAMGASLLNVVMILTVYFIAPRFGADLDHQVFGLAAGVLIAGVAQAAFQMPSLRKMGFRLEWITPWKHPVVRDVVAKMLPGTLGVAAFQLNVILTQSIAFHIDPVINASFDYAVRLMEFPQGVFGISLATYLLSALSGLAAEKNYSGFRETLMKGIQHLLFANMLASVLLLTLAEPMVRLIFERGSFSTLSTDRTAVALASLAPGLVFFSLVNVLARAFYALGDTQTPMKIGAFCLGINLFLAWWLIEPFRQGGMGAANTISSMMNVGLLLYGLKRKMPRFDYRPLKSSAIAMGSVAVLAGLLAWGSRLGWNSWIGHKSLPARIGEVFVPIGIATAAYCGITWWLGIGSAREMLELATRRFRKRPKTEEPTDGNPS